MGCATTITDYARRDKVWIVAPVRSIAWVFRPKTQPVDSISRIRRSPKDNGRIIGKFRSKISVEQVFVDDSFQQPDDVAVHEETVHGGWRVSCQISHGDVLRGVFGNTVVLEESLEEIHALLTRGLRGSLTAFQVSDHPVTGPVVGANLSFVIVFVGSLVVGGHEVTFLEDVLDDLTVAGPFNVLPKWVGVSFVLLDAVYDTGVAVGFDTRGRESICFEYELGALV